MIDDQSAVLAYKTIYKAKTAKKMRKMRDAVLRAVVEEQCREVAETALEEAAGERPEQEEAGPAPRSDKSSHKDEELEELQLEKMPSRVTNNEAMTSQMLYEGDITSINIPYQPSDIYNSQCNSPSKEDESCKIESSKVKICEFDPYINKDEEEPPKSEREEERRSQDMKVLNNEALGKVENTYSSIDLKGSPDNLLNTASKDDEPRDPDEARKNENMPESLMSSPLASNVNEPMQNHPLDLSKRSVDFNIQPQQISKTTRNEPSSAAPHSQSDLGRMLKRQQPKEEQYSDNSRYTGRSYMGQRRSSGGNRHSPKMADVGPRVPSALGIAESKAKSRVMVPSHLLSIRHARNRSNQDHTSDLRSTSSYNLSAQHKSPTTKRRNLAATHTSNTAKVPNSGVTQKESTVPHVNLRFQRNMKKMSSESRFESNKSKRHKFNPDGKKDSDTPTFINENSMTSSTQMPKKTLKTSTKNSRTMYGLNQNSGLQKSVEVRPTSSQRGNAVAHRSQKKHNYLARAVEKDNMKAGQMTHSAIPLSEIGDGLNRSTDGLFEQKSNFTSKQGMGKHHKNPSFQPNASAASVQVASTQSAIKERKLSQNGQYAASNKAMNQTKSLKSSILFKTTQQKEIGKVTNKFVKPKTEKPETESESKQATHQRGQKRGHVTEPKTPKKRQDMPTSDLQRQLQAGMSPLAGRTSKPNVNGSHRLNLANHNGYDQTSNSGGLVFQRKQSHQVLGHLSLKERRLQHEMRQQQEEMRQKQQEHKLREKRQWDRAIDKVAREMLDQVLGNIAETTPGFDEQEEQEGVLTAVVIQSIQHVEDEQREQMMRHERALWGQAMKMVQKKMIRSVTQRCVTEIIQESTDAIYKFEDDAISLADWVLRSLLQKEIRNEIFEAVKDTAVRNKPIQFTEEDDFSIIQPQEALGSDRDGALEIPQERNYNPNKYRMNLFDSQTNSSKFEELAVGTPSKQSQGDRILYDQMMEDYSINGGMHNKLRDGQPSKISHTTQQSVRSSFVHDSGAKAINQSEANAMEFDDSRRHQSNIMRESSRGLDKIRKSVIQQQSERYLMRRGRKTNSRGSLPNLGATSFQTTRNIDIESQREIDDSRQDTQPILTTQGNKPRDDEGIIVVKKVSKTQLQNVPRKIQNPNDSLRFVRNPSKYSSIEGNEVVERQKKGISNRTPVQDPSLIVGYHGTDKGYGMSQIDAFHLETPMGELEGTGPFFGTSMISPDKTPNGYQQSAHQIGLHLKTTPHSQMYNRPAQEQKKDDVFEEAPGVKKTKKSYVDHEIQRYSRNIDADEEGVRQEAHTSRLPNNVISPAYSEVSRYRVDHQSVEESAQERYQRQLERQAAKDKRLVAIPKSRVHTAQMGEKEPRPTSQKRVKHATIAIASLIGSDGESLSHNSGPGSRMSNRSYQNMLESQVSSMPPTQPTNSTLLSPGFGTSLAGNSPAAGPNLSSKPGPAYSGLSPTKNARRTKKMIVTHQIIHPKSLKPNPNENHYQQKHQPIPQNSEDSGLHQNPEPQQYAEDEALLMPQKGMNIKPIFQYGHQNFTHAGAKNPPRPSPNQHPQPKSWGLKHEQRTTPDKVGPNTYGDHQHPQPDVKGRQYAKNDFHAQPGYRHIHEGGGLRNSGGSQQQSQRKQAGKGRGQAALQRSGGKTEGVSSRVQPRKSGLGGNVRQSQIREQREQQMKQLEQIEKELRDDEMQFDAFSGDDMHESVIGSDQEFSINPSAYEEIHNEAQLTEAHQRVQERNMVRRR